MDHVLHNQDLERKIEQLMTERGIDRVEAIAILGNWSGEVYGDGDLVAIRPLTDEERHRSGLSHSLDEVMAAQRARRSGTKIAAAATGTPDRPNDAATEEKPR